MIDVILFLLFGIIKKPLLFLWVLVILYQILYLILTSELF